MKPRSKFAYKIKDGVLLIIDQYDDFNPTMSVTNDMENVLEYISIAERVEVQKMPIAYKDTEGSWDGVNFSNGTVSWIYLASNNEDDVIKEIKDKLK